MPKDAIMKIQGLMIPQPITIHDSASITDAIELMKANSIRHLPVVTSQNLLRGLVTLADLKQGLMPSMVSDLSLTDLMISDPITVSPDEDIETAARLIYQHKISGMPVVKNKRLVGIITETDILRAFIDMMGILNASSRIDVIIKDEPGAFKQASQLISDSGGDIINVGMAAQHANKRIYYFRLAPCETDPIRRELQKCGFEVLEAMD